MDEIREAIQEAIKNKKTDQARKANEVFSVLNMLNTKKYSEAIKKLEMIKENTLVYRSILEIFRAEAYEELGDNKAAEGTYLKVQEKDPTLIITYCKLFELYYNKMNKKSKAMDQWKLAQARKPGHWKVLQIKKWLETRK